MQLNETDIEQFNSEGFLIFRQLIDAQLLNEIKNQTKAHLNLRLPPFELEATLGYPRAPLSVDAEGGETIRRLLLAYSRDSAFREWGKNRVVKAILQQLLATEQVFLVQSHHNCIMTKQPDYSSKTRWHRDVRYWRFENDELINTWLAMGPEVNANGCLKVLPGSHRWPNDRDMVDENLFLKTDHPNAQESLAHAIDVELHAGDVLFFHAGLFHAANHNSEQQVKNSLVYSYHGESNAPIPETKSTTFEEVLI